MHSTQNILDTSVLPQSKASTAEAEQGSGATAIVPPSEVPGRFDASVNRMIEITDGSLLKQHIDCEMRRLHYRNFSVSSTADPGESRY